MAITNQDFSTIDRILADHESDGQALTLLRQALPHLAFAGCDAADIEDKPLKLYPRFDLHCFDNTDHCMKLVASPDAATGVILARLKKVRTSA